MMLRSFVPMLAVLVLMPFHAMAADAAGTLKTLTGTAHITRAGSAPQGIAAGAAVAVNDIVETDAGARAVFSFSDGAELVMTGKGRLVIDEYVFDADKKSGNKAVLDIFEAAFSYTGGALDKGVKPEVKLNIDYGTIGIRGTKLVGARRNGITWIYLSEGGALFENTGGKTEIAPGYGTRISGKAEAPAPAYLWGEAEIAWLQRFVDDPASHETPAMASNMDFKKAMPSAERAPALSAPAAPAAMPEPSGGASNGAASGMVASEPSAKAKQSRAGVSDAAPAESAQQPDGPPIFEYKRGSTVAGSLITEDGGGNLRIDAREPVTVQLAEVNVAAYKLQNTVLLYAADVKASALNGSAHLQVLVHFPGNKAGQIYASDMAAGEWKPLTGEFALPPGNMPDVIKVNLVIDGTGSVLLRNLRLMRQ